MNCPVCKKKGIKSKGYYTGGFENHNDPKRYYKADFYCCDSGHKWEIGQKPGERKKTTIIKDTEGDEPLTTPKEYEEYCRIVT